jgi:peptide/nickel transport system ATP-binding protein
MTEQRVIVDALNIDYPAARVVNNLSFTLGNERLALVGNPARANRCPPAP